MGFSFFPFDALIEPMRVDEGIYSAPSNFDYTKWSRTMERYFSGWFAEMEGSYHLILLE